MLAAFPACLTLVWLVLYAANRPHSTRRTRSTPSRNRGQPSCCSASVGLTANQLLVCRSFRGLTKGVQIESKSPAGEQKDPAHHENKEYARAPT
jgi:hypothetical protein